MKPSTKAKIATVTKKAGKTAAKAGEYATKNPMAVLYGFLAIGGIYLGYKLLKGTGDTVDTLTHILDGDQNIDNQVDNTGGSATKATITDQAAINYAQQLLDASNVKKPLYGTDNDTIEAVFDKLKNGDDYIKVYNAFGKKDYNGYNSPPEGFWSYLDSYEKKDLNYWLKSELSSTLDAALYKKVKTRIESTNIFVF